jgi:aspartate kinase
MKVFKFGGASVNNVERIQNVAEILDSYRQEPLLVVISAMGKTTNALEQVTRAFFQGHNAEALELFHNLKTQHTDMAKALLPQAGDPVFEHLNNAFTEAEWLLHDKPVREYDYYYDQLVSVGELLSTIIVSHYLNARGLTNTWIDVRDYFRTDDNFRDAQIDWEFTQEKVRAGIAPLLQDKGMVITQGFIGATDENESTTLGREGSDYTAAVFANMLDAESQTIWKDVTSVMSADPRDFPDAQPIATLNYNEVIEMAFYGAQVIHPKTIKPLQNKGIPLYVKCFLDKELPGTVIHDKPVHGLPPIIVLKQDQVLLQLNSKDFSFVGERPVAQLYHWLEETRLRPNLTQNGAISFMCCMDDHPEKLERLALKAAELFDVQVEKGLTLLTIRHYTTALLESMTKDKTIVLRQQSPETVQVLMRS